jgi:hypothetical protein
MGKWKDTHGVPAPQLKGGKGTTKRVAVIDDRDGSVGGHHTEHWDGRQDANIIAKALRVKAKVKE